MHPILIGALVLVGWTVAGLLVAAIIGALKHKDEDTNED